MLCWDQTRQPVCPTGSATGGGIEGPMSGCEGWWCHCPLDAVPRGDMGRKGTRPVGQGGPESWGFCGGLHRQLPPRPKPSSTPRTAPLPLPAPCSEHTGMLLGPAISTPSHPFGEILGSGSRVCFVPQSTDFLRKSAFPSLGLL